MLIRNLNHINTFLHVADTGSISSASRMLRKSQTSVSNSVCNLEIELGIDLLKRDGHKAVPTVEALKLIPYLKNLLNYEEMIADVVDDLSVEKPDLNIYLDSAIPSPFCDIFEHLITDDSFGTVRLYRGSPADGLSMVKRGDINVAITINEELKINSLSQCVLGYSRAYIVSSKTHPLSQSKVLNVNELCKYRQIALTAREQYVPEAFRPVSNKVCYVESFDDMLRLIEKGVGWGVMPYYFISEQLDSGELMEVSRNYEKGGILTKIYCYFSTSLQAYDAFNQFLESARDKIRAMDI